MKSAFLVAICHLRSVVGQSCREYDFVFIFSLVFYDCEDGRQHEVRRLQSNPLVQILYCTVGDSVKLLEEQSYTVYAIMFRRQNT